MQYFTFALDEDSQSLCVISTPLGLYKYKRLPMGIKQSSDIAREVMENLFRDLDDVEVYIDEIGCFSSSFSTHIHTLDIILTSLEQNNFTMNPSKCEWVVQKTDLLGYWLTRRGLKPWSKNIKAITAMQAPVNIKQIHIFI